MIKQFKYNGSCFVQTLCCSNLKSLFNCNSGLAVNHTNKQSDGGAVYKASTCLQQCHIESQTHAYFRETTKHQHSSLNNANKQLTHEFLIYDANSLLLAKTVLQNYKCIGFVIQQNKDSKTKLPTSIIIASKQHYNKQKTGIIMHS